MLRPLLLLLSIFVVSAPAGADIYKYVTDDGVLVYSDIPVHKEAALFYQNKQFSSRAFESFKSNMYDNIKKYYPIARDLAEEYLVDPELVKAIITVESSWYPKAVSSKGAMGLMQLMPLTAKSLAVTDAFDPEENISGGVRYFRMLLDLFNGDLRDSLAAYNAGPTRIKNGEYLPSETKRYISKVLKLYGGEEKFEYVPLERKLDSRPIFKIMLDDGTLLFTDTPIVSDGESF
jgi:hypothetical protein